MIKRINTLMSACRLISNRPDILALWGVARADDLTDGELVECGRFMETAYRGKTTEAPEQIRRLRSQAMTLINRLGKYATPDDWTEVNRFLLQRKICGRLLYMLDAQDLGALIRKLRAIRDKRAASADIGGTTKNTPASGVVFYPLMGSAGAPN
jgi:hypothetical protein